MSGAAPEEFERLVAIMARLRGPDGCPWDREQTASGLRRQLLEECYELVDAVDSQIPGHLCEELGDLLLHIVFQARLGEERGEFAIGDVLRAINEKLIRRHPHVFGDEIATHADRVVEKWEEIKAGERAAKGETHESVLDGIPPGLAALLLAEAVQRRASRVGFDWPDGSGALGKVREELDELVESVESREDPEEELGDLLFAVVNYARFLGVSPEVALRRAVMKFAARFRRVEAVANSDGRPLERLTLGEMDALWDAAKREERGEGRHDPACGSTSS